MIPGQNPRTYAPDKDPLAKKVQNIPDNDSEKNSNSTFEDVTSVKKKLVSCLTKSSSCFRFRN